jgi:hypothetical protein
VPRPTLPDRAQICQVRDVLVEYVLDIGSIRSDLQGAPIAPSCSENRPTSSLNRCAHLTLRSFCMPCLPPALARPSFISCARTARHALIGRGA